MHNAECVMSWLGMGCAYLKPTLRLPCAFLKPNLSLGGSWAVECVYNERFIEAKSWGFKKPQLIDCVFVS